MKGTPAAKDAVARFGELITAGITAWVEAGQLLTASLQDDPLFRQKVLKAHHWVTLEILDTFERIGRREIYPQLMLDGSPGARRLVMLPYAVQQAYCNGKVNVVTLNGKTFATAEKKVHELSHREASLVFSETGIRSVAEQREKLAPVLMSRGANSYAGPVKGGGNGDRAVKTILAGIVDEDGADAAEVEEEEEPEGDLGECLRTAQAMLLRARELMAEQGKGAALDNYITAALAPIGKLRFALGDGKR